MKIALTGDWHFGYKKNSEIFLNNSLNIIRNEFIPYLKKNNITTIYILGDLFDNRTHINIKTKHEVYNLFNIDFKDFNIIIIKGNHDCFFKSSTEINSITSMFDKFSNVEVIEDIELKTIDDKKMLFVSWQVDNNKLEEKILNKNIWCDCAFFHIDAQNVPMSKNNISKDGLQKSVFFKNYNLSFSGHYHSFSEHVQNNNKLVYIGTPYELNRNDKNEAKGFCVLDTKTMDYKFVDTKNYIKFIDITYPEIPEESKITGNIVDILVVIDKDFSDKDYQKYLKLINSFNPLLVNPITKYAIFNSVDNTNKTFAVKSTMESVHEYIHEVLDITDEDKSTIFNKIEKLYSECKQI